MFTRTLPTALLLLLASSGGLVLTAGAGDASAGACPPPVVADVEPTGTSPTSTEPIDDRCDLDAAAYYLGYREAEADVMQTTTAGAPTGASTTAGGPVAPSEREDAAGDAVVAEPLPSPIPDEPGVLDDNTFVDAGDSLWVSVADDRESTFALDVDTGSFDVAQQFLATGHRPEPDSIRPEEWVNHFRYGDDHVGEESLGVTIESSTGVAAAGDSTVVRVGVTSQRLSDSERPSANITFVIDTSGSMDIRERLGLVKASLALLVRSLRTDDTISIVTYGDVATPVLAPTPVAEWRSIVDAIDELEPSGSTNMEDGLRLGYEQARRSFDPDALNVVVLASDGVANVGVTDADVLTDEITQAGEEGINLVTVGYGMGNYNDHLMEQLADLGDGFYSYVDTFGEAVELFVDELTPTLTVVAEEAKVQVVFDDEVVGSYRLIGYENRALDDADFSDDTVDAGEIGAGHQVSAVYELELLDDANAADGVEAGEVRLRWRDVDTDEVVELEQPLVLGTGGADDPTPSLRFAALVAHTAEVLRDGSVVGERGVSLEDLLVEAEALDDDGVDGAGELAELIATAIYAAPATADLADPAEG